MVSDNGEIQERFLGFTDVSRDRSANALADYIFHMMDEFNCGSKLVTQCYNGAAVMTGEFSGLQKRVKEKYPDALFIHCFAHRLNLVLSQTTSNIKECKIFFITLSNFSSFFSKSTKRTAD